MILFLLFASNIYGQSTETYYFDANGNITGGTHIKTLPPDEEVLIEPITNTKFYLDSTHVYITAINAKGDTLWRTDPWKDSNTHVYRTDRPIIVNWYFTHLDREYSNEHAGELIIWLVYINTQFGVLSLLDGKYYFYGQD